jgi:integrase
MRAYDAGRRTDAASDATINRELAILRRGFSLGLQEEPPLVRRVIANIKACSNGPRSIWPPARSASRSGRRRLKLPRTLPIYGDMAEWLELQAERRLAECDLVFHWNGKPLGSHLKGWDRACASVGLEELHFHDLRRSAVRNVERAGVPRSVAMKISGHRTESVYRRYDIVVESDLQAAAQKMEQ